MRIRKGTPDDIPAIYDIYSRIHDEIEQGRFNMLWFRDLYPTRSWAEEHVAAGDLYVMEDDCAGDIIASAIINHSPLPEYFQGKWYQPENYDNILILHTLVVHPAHKGRGYGSEFLRFFEQTARLSGCTRLRLDTQEIDIPARNLYKKFGYTEADFLPCEFKGITGIDLVLIEKILC